MNIFVLDSNPQKAARFHCDKHCVKQIVESYQMLGSAVLRHGAQPSEMPLTKAGSPLRGGYPNHPCTRWAGNTQGNFLWLGELALELCLEYSRRYGKTHFCEKGIEKLVGMASKVPAGGLTDFAVAISKDSSCRSIKGFDSLSVVQQYREYYNIDKSYFAKWSKGSLPHWFKKRVGIRDSP